MREPPYVTLGSELGANAPRNPQRDRVRTSSASRFPKYELPFLPSEGHFKTVHETDLPEYGLFEDPLVLWNQDGRKEEGPSLPATHILVSDLDIHCALQGREDFPCWPDGMGGRMKRQAQILCDAPRDETEVGPRVGEQGSFPYVPFPRQASGDKGSDDGPSTLAHH